MLTFSHHGAWWGAGRSGLRDWNLLANSLIHLPQLPFREWTESLPLWNYFLSVLKISNEFEKRSLNLQKKVGLGMHRERFVFRRGVCFILQVAAKRLELFSHLDFRQLAEIHIIWSGVFLCKAFLFYQVHFTPARPGLIVLAMPREIGLAVCRGTGDRRLPGGVSPGAWGLQIECLWGWVWEASFYLM